MSLHFIFILIVFLINNTVNVVSNDTVNVEMNVNDDEINNSTENNTPNVKENRNSIDDPDSDDKYQLRKLHSNPSAEIFLEGCTNLYSSPNGSDPLKNDERIFKLDNPDRLLIMGIFTLHEFSILLYIEDPFNKTQNQSYVNITLGINRNSAASISGYGNITQFGNDTIIDDNNDLSGYNGELIPALPYYIALNTSTPTGEAHVTELRLKKQDQQNDPFLKYKYAEAGKQIKFEFFRIDHAGPIYAHYSCCELQCDRQTFHRISGCNLYSTRSSSTKRRTPLQYYYKDVKDKKDTINTFSGVFFIKRPISTPLAVKFRFYDHKRQGDYYDIVLTDTYAAINQHILKDNTTVNETLPFLQENSNIVTVNITITSGGRVSLTRTYESKPYMVHELKLASRENVEAKVKFSSMSMSKLYNDEIRYDFYYNCSDVLTYFNETKRSNITKIMNKTVHRFNEERYDLVKIFVDSFSLDDRFGKYYEKENHEFEDIDFEEAERDKNSENKLPSHFVKALTGACSVLFIAILKYLSGLKCVRYMTQDVLDDEKLKKYRNNISDKFDSGVTTFFGDE